jgi:PPOX class probable F420-dependent enzyme
MRRGASQKVEESTLSKRADIKLAPDEIAQFIDDARLVVASTHGGHGFPHVVPLWFLREGVDIVAWSYAKSQKVHNLRRDPRATLMFESGDSYTELRGVVLECHVDVVDDPAEISRAGKALAIRYRAGVESAYRGDGAAGVVDEQAKRRCVLRFRPVRTISWDHSKMVLPPVPESS